VDPAARVTWRRHYVQARVQDLGTDWCFQLPDMLRQDDLGDVTILGTPGRDRSSCSKVTLA
jgi:hypothetical protein